MELSSAVISGVQAAGSSSVDEKAFQKLLTDGFGSVLEECSSSEENKSAPFKEALFGLCSLIIELARVDADGPTISSVLEECKFSSERTLSFTTKYLESKDRLRASLERVGSTLPHVVDVHWRLDYYLKNNHVERVSRPEYLISFDTQVLNNSGGQEVQFMCTQEQLQDLVLKLKDATKTLDKYLQN